MAKVSYTKQALTYAQQLQQLKDRGLAVENDDKALHLLENISYYRLSGYWYPLLIDKQNHQFKPDASFTKAFKLYCFDRELRKMMVGELEKIEIGIRAKMIHVLSLKHGPFWFETPALFSNLVKHANSLTSIGKEYNRSDEEFVRSFKAKYSDPLPPSWMTLEITSFGTLSMLYQNLKPTKERRDIAHYFGLPDTVFQTWLHSIVYLRNVCAHHTRLWNRGMRIRPQFPRSPHNQWLNNGAVRNNRSYFILSMVLYLLQTVNPNNSFAVRFKELLAKYPNVDVGAMGFPVDWENEPLWN